MAVGAQLSAAAPTAAQVSPSLTGVVEGVARAADTGAVMEGVLVRIEGSDRNGVTNEVGRFHIPAVAEGAHTLLAERLGYAPAVLAVTVRPGATVSVELRLAVEALRFPELVVSASREARRRAETPASVGIVTGDEIRRTRPSHPSEIMNRVAGVWVNVTSGEGHQTAIRQPKTTSPVYLFLEDGVPTRSTGFFNHNALYEVNVPQSDRIEVVKGPATSLYGSDAIGGVVNVLTRSAWDGPAMTATLEGGAFGFGRALVSGSLRGERDALRLDVNVTRTDGWRDGTAYDRQSVTLRWDRHMPAGATLRTVATFSNIDQSTAGSSAIAEEDFRSRPTINYTPISYRQVRAARVTTTYDRLGARTLLTLSPFVRWNEMELLPNWSLPYDPAISNTGHASAGALAKVRYEVATGARIIGGLDLDYSPGIHREWRVAPQRSGRIFEDYTREEAIYDYRVAFVGASPYVQAELSPVERVYFVAGLRYDNFGYDYDNRLDVVQTGRHRRPASTRVTYTHLSPKLGATWELHRSLGLFASYGRGFRAPSEGQLFRQGQAENTIGLEPVKADQLEAGVRGGMGDRVNYEVAAYRLVKSDDILSHRRADGSTETVNAGETLHRGVELTLGVAPIDGVRIDGTYSRALHRYTEWQPQPGLDLSGREMEDAPRTLAGINTTFAPAILRGVTLGAEWSRVGSYWMDAQNTHRYAGHGLFHLRASAPLTSAVTVHARLMNAGNARYAEGAAYTAARGQEYAPGLPRALYLGVQLR
jgi:iron complex outermembrane recepter protein